MNMNATTPAGRRRISRSCTKKLQSAVKTAACALVVLLLVRASVCRAAADADLSKLQPGMALPAIRIVQDLTPEQRSYLGLPGRLIGMFTGKGFKPSDVAADVLVIEFFNVYCTSCQSQASILNEVFQRVNSRDDMRDRVKFFGIGAGNNQQEAAMFMRRYSVGFPMFPDPDFVNYEAVGEPGATPLTIIARKHGKELLVVSAHAGLVKNADVFMTAIRTALASSPDGLAAESAQKEPAQAVKRPRIELNMSDDQIEQAVLTSMRRAAGGDDSITSVRTVSYPRSGDIFVATPAGAVSNLYAQVVSRPPTCDVCHGVHFILVFDGAGILRYFEPLHLTKYGNVVWTQYDADFMRRHLIGLDVRQPFEYNPSVDSVTTATMTSVIIYNSAQRLRDVLKEIKSQ
ncbi:MAG: hypothetical protein FJ119_00265 [Deltaproteobacteria bacterium]|nr:hypothetical protein [Deltaproteobacteria bacterium]